jgi:hypothetical protein
MLLHNDIILVPVHINGRVDKLHFQLDTGADRSIIDENVARRLGIGLGEEVSLLTLLGPRTARLLELEILEFGSVQDVHVPALSFDLTAMSEALDTHLDGVLGLDVLARVPIAIDFANKRLTFPSPSTIHPGFRIEVSKRDELYQVPVSLDGSVSCEMVLDTGSNITTVPFQLWEQMAPGANKDKVVGLKTAGESAAQAFLARLVTMQLGGFKIERPPVLIRHVNAGVIGNDLLKRFQITLDLPHGQIFLVEDRNYHVDSLRYTTVGIQVLKRGADFWVASVWEGSPASQAGMSSGDQLLKIDGEPVLDATLEKISERLRGPEGSFVRLTLRRGGHTLLFELRRQNLLP